MSGQKTRKDKQRQAVVARIPLQILRNWPEIAQRLITARLAKNDRMYSLAFEDAILHCSTRITDETELPSGGFTKLLVSNAEKIGVESFLANNNIIEELTEKVHPDGSESRWRGVTLHNKGVIRSFVSASGKESVLFHELIHATGSHLKRWKELPNAARGPNADYYSEDLVAEIGEKILLLASVGRNIGQSECEAIASKVYGDYFKAHKDGIEYAYRGSTRLRSEFESNLWFKQALDAVEYLTS